MADEAILRIVIVDDAHKASSQPIPPIPAASPSGPRQEMPTIQSFATLHTALEGLTADFARAAISIRQMVAQTTAAPKYIDVTPPKAIASSSQQNYAGNLSDLMKKMGTTKISANEVKSSFAGAGLTPQEQTFLEQIIVQGKKYNQVAGEMGVHPTRVTQIAQSVKQKVGADQSIHKMLLGVEQENKAFATNEQRLGQRSATSDRRLDMMSEQEAGGQYGEKVPTWEKLMNRFTDAWMKEADPEVGGQLTKAMEAISAGKVPKEALESARKAKSIPLALKRLSKHFASGGEIPSYEFGYYDPLDFGDDPDVPGSWMDPSDFSIDHIPHGIVMDPSSTGPGGSVYSHYARGGEVGGGVPPESGLVVAGIGKDGKIYYGKKGNLHDHLEETFGYGVFEDHGSIYGFAGTDGQFLTREEADVIAERLYANREHSNPGRLDSTDLPEYRPDLAQTHGGTPIPWDDDDDELGYARGGRIDMSRGGGVPNMGHAASGADWHPAWLTDKEFVINARSAARNREALQAANANPDVTLTAKHYAAGGPAIASILAAAGQQTGIGSAATMNTLSIAGGPIGQVAALMFEAQKQFSAQMVGAARGVGEFANALADPDANPAKSLGKAGDSIAAAGDKMHNTILSVLGESVKQFAGFMDSVTGTAKRYGEFSPNIAAAEAMVDIQQTMGDFRRAQEAGPELARYIKAQGDLQQRFEDAKMKLLLKILPAVTTIVNTLEAIMAAGDKIPDVLGAMALPLTAGVEVLARIAGAAEEANRVEVQDPTEALFQINAIRVPNADV